MKIIAQNKKARFDYMVLDTVETGIVLKGSEVKSLRAGHLVLNGAFATFHGGELFMINAKITAYANAYDKSEDNTTRSRKLLMHKKELNKLFGQVSQKGITLVPLKVYFNNKGLVNVEIGLCKHKNAANKKQALKEKDIKRDTDREIKSHR